MRYHNFIARRSEFGATGSRFGRCSHSVVENAKGVNVPARMCSCQLRMCCLPGCETLPQVLKGNGIEWRPYAQNGLVPSVLNPPLRRSSSPMVPPPICAARLRRPESAWAATSSASRLGCRIPQSAAGQRSGAGSVPLAKTSTTQRAWSTCPPCPHGKRTARCPS